MKKTLLFIAVGTLFAGSAFAQATPAAAPAAAVSGVCKDGSAYSAATTKGACRGHGGIDKSGGAAAPAAAAAAPAPMAKDSAAPKSAAPAAASGSAKTPAPGGGPDKVWANDITKVYHCQGDKYYGTTKKGEYMSEADAKAKGYHGDHGKACAK